MTPTLTDRIVPWYTRFVYGFGIISILIGIVNFGMLAITMITVKGIYIPLWMIPVFAFIVGIFCTASGWFFEKYEIWNRITSHQNKNTNPEFKGLLKDIEIIKNNIEIIKNR